MLIGGIVIFSLAYYFSKPSPYDIRVVRWVEPALEAGLPDVGNAGVVARIQH